MNDTQLTLDSFFQFRQASAFNSADLEALESTMPVVRVKEAIQEADKNNSLLVKTSALLDPIGELLDVSLGDIIVRAWTENKLFEKFLDPEKYNPQESILISLKKHKVSSSHKPYIDVSLNGKKIDTIDFQIDLTLTLEGVVLKIRDGRVCEIQSGTMKGSGTVKCEGLVLLKRDTGSINLPGAIKFSEVKPT